MIARFGYVLDQAERLARVTRVKEQLVNVYERARATNPRYFLIRALLRSPLRVCLAVKRGCSNDEKYFARDLEARCRRNDLPSFPPA